MLQLNVVLIESYDEKTNEFISESVWPLKLEHSLVSLSKWESKHEKAFLGKGEKSEEEILDYVRMMDLSPETPPEVFLRINNDQYREINTYINAKMTATWFNRRTNAKPNTQTVTSELIYYWITSFEIPWEVEHWHLNRLFTLIEVFNEERSAKEKPTRKSGQSVAADRRAMNEARKKQLGTSG